MGEVQSIYICKRPQKLTFGCHSISLVIILWFDLPLVLRYYWIDLLPYVHLYVIVWNRHHPQTKVYLSTRLLSLSLPIWRAVIACVCEGSSEWWGTGGDKPSESVSEGVGVECERRVRNNQRACAGNTADRRPWPRKVVSDSVHPSLPFSLSLPSASLDRQAIRQLYGYTL